jgi:hypothetical protein
MKPQQQAGVPGVAVGFQESKEEPFHVGFTLNANHFVISPRKGTCAS